MNNEHPQLNSAQKTAAEAEKGPLLIVAGAGTGKTRTLMSRIVYLIEKGIPPEKICAITFTNKAANEMSQRIMKSAEGSAHITTAHKPYIGTFHSLGARILRKECRLLGRDPSFTIFDDHDSFDLVKKAVKGFFPKPTSKTATKKKETPAFFAQKITEIKNLGKPIADSRSSEEENELIQAVYHAYEDALRRNNAFDFDDLIGKPVELFRTQLAVLKKYQMMYDAILVDEWQDINPKQYELVKFLAGGHRNLSVVGDDEQTIYSWRYADVKTFLNFDKDWVGAKVHFLEENYRSTATIINAASAVVQNNRFRAPKKLWTGNAGGDAITLFEAWGENDEAAWIANTILKLEIRNSDSTAAILYRTNAQSRAIEQALIRHDIPYRIFGGLKFYERREVKDAVAALRYVANPKDEVSKERLEKNLTKKKFAAFRTAIAAASSLKPSEILNCFLEVFGYFDYLEGNFINSNEREENISELAAFVADFESLDELLERLSLLQSTDDENRQKGKNEQEKPASSMVTLMTIHMAKGLEFDTVFIAGVAEGLLPHIRSIDSEDSLEEERRLMYVAMTRARKKLYLSYYGLPSRFLGEIPSEYITMSSLASDEDSYKEDEIEFD